MPRRGGGQPGPPAQAGPVESNSFNNYLNLGCMSQLTVQLEAPCHRGGRRMRNGTEAKKKGKKTTEGEEKTGDSH